MKTLYRIRNYRRVVILINLIYRERWSMINGYGEMQK